MSHEGIVDELVAMIADLVAVPPEGVDASTPLFEGGLDLDSFELVELIAKVEARFGFTFLDDDLRPEHFVVGQLAALIEARTRP